MTSYNPLLKSVQKHMNICSIKGAPRDSYIGSTLLLRRNTQGDRGAWQLTLLFIRKNREVGRNQQGTRKVPASLGEGHLFLWEKAM